MIRIELLYGHRRQVPSWLGPTLFAMVLCAGIYGINAFFPFSELVDSFANDDSASSQNLWQEVPNRPSEALEETAAGSEVSPPLASAESTESLAKGLAPTQEAVPTAERVAAAPPSPAEVAALPLAAKGVEAGYGPQFPKRSVACQSAVQINERVPPGISLASLHCRSAGEYLIEGTSVSPEALRVFKEHLQKIPSELTLSSWSEGKGQAKVLRFQFQGRFAENSSRDLAILSSDQADKLFGKVAHWADESGLDGLLIDKPIAILLPSAHSHQRQKLWGTGSYQQIGAFVSRLDEVEDFAVLGEAILMPVQRGESEWVEARLYVAVDVVVGMP